jgi:hypothetical protein
LSVKIGIFHVRDANLPTRFGEGPILEEVDGYNLGQTYKEAVAAEIGFSRKICAKGYQLVQIGRSRHSVIAHPQWPTESLSKRLFKVFKRK